MADISTITLPNGNVYNIKDSVARAYADNFLIINPGIKILLIGDSYNYGNGGITGRGWGYYFDQLNGTSSTIIHQNTGGFAAVANSANASYNNCNFAQVIDQLSASEEYDLIIAQAGWNDASTSKNPSGVSAIKSGVSSFISKCRAKWPGCKIFIVATNNDTICDDYKISCLNAISDTARDNGVFRSTRSSALWLQGTGVNADDNIHLNDEGYQLLAKLITNHITGWDGELNNSYSETQRCVAFSQGLKITWGFVTLTTDGAASIIFPIEYRDPPNVMCAISGISRNYMFDVRSGNITTTGCDIIALRLNGTRIEAASQYTVRWYAIGV